MSDLTEAQKIAIQKVKDLNIKTDMLVKCILEFLKKNASSDLKESLVLRGPMYLLTEEEKLNMSESVSESGCVVEFLHDRIILKLK